jgi:hypothetical protein
VLEQRALRSRIRLGRALGALTARGRQLERRTTRASKLLVRALVLSSSMVALMLVVSVSERRRSRSELARRPWRGPARNSVTQLATLLLAVFARKVFQTRLMTQALPSAARTSEPRAAARD